MEKYKNNLRIYLIISSIVWFFSLFPAFIMVMFSPMLFDAPGSETSTWTIAVAAGMLSYPFITVLSIIFSWVFFVKKMLKISLVLSLIPLVWIGVNSVLWMCIELFCDGSLTC